MIHLLRAAGIGLFAFATAPLFALSGSGDSAAGSLDTVAPTPGTATVPANGIISGESIPYSGATDTSGIARVELWARENSASWAFSDVVTDGNAAGSFTYIPAASGTYHFDLVAEDTVGNRSTAPSGSTGTGQGSTTFTTSAGDWGILE